MKRIALTIMIFAGVFTSCSTEDVTMNNDNNNGSNPYAVAPLSEPGSTTCADAAALGGIAVLSNYTGPQVVFNWNNTVEHSADMTYVSYIEISEDPACPKPVYAAAVEATYPIDVFNTSSLVISGVSAKCFNWRIVINGYVNSNLECTATTEWKHAAYVQ